MSCIEALQHRQAEQELADVQRSIEATQRRRKCAAC